MSALEEKKNFNDSEQLLADYILVKKEKVLEQSIQQLSEETFTSTSTIFRLCQKIGLKGFKDFKIRLAAELQMNYNKITNINPDFPFNEGDTYGEIPKKVLELFTDSLKNTYTIIDKQQVEKAVAMILGAKKIGIFAYGDTFLPALNFQNKMMKINTNVQIGTLPGENRHLATNFTKEDCAIVLSYSGESKDNYMIANILRQNQTKIIVISAYPDSHIAKLASLVLPVAKNESKSVKLSTFSSQIAIDYMLNVLYACIFMSNYEVNQNKRVASEMLFLNTRFEK
ncbi:MurR/RpiR family transcriptional regulator [Enterococcus rivorum]|uniref:RpiR family transcriptional regulator n=2 Tax=Enterococcus rivorum TaxID=762845 RepID=A0A1E5KYK5_9ENTE|nr:MurR/RpiR family transcriptional regulator [Enterococcus rivorum]OEH82945.1 hypothetical protein BCR26_01330 [Enterococcus rivorum]